MSDRFARPGTIWVCGACGKTATDQYGIEGEHSPGWDESCMLNSILCDAGSLVCGTDGRAIMADSIDPEPRRVASRFALTENKPG